MAARYFNWPYLRRSLRLAWERLFYYFTSSITASWALRPSVAWISTSSEPPVLSEMIIRLANLKWNIFHLHHSLWFESRWTWFKLDWNGKETEFLQAGHPETLPLRGWVRLAQRRPENKTVWRKENNPVVLRKGQSLQIKRVWRQLSPLSVPWVGCTPTSCLNIREILRKSHGDIWHFV